MSVGIVELPGRLRAVERPERIPHAQRYAATSIMLQLVECPPRLERPIWHELGVVDLAKPGSSRSDTRIS